MYSLQIITSKHNQLTTQVYSPIDWVSALITIIRIECDSVVKRFQLLEVHIWSGEYRKDPPEPAPGP